MELRSEGGLCQTVATGKAKLLIRTVFCSTWAESKDQLLKEFGNKLSNAEAHRLLQSTKMKQNDDLGEYVLKMREIGKCNGVDEISIIQYIVDGIYDHQSNKSMLYGVSSIVELRSKLLAYERFKAAFNDKNNKSESKTNASGSNSKKNSFEKSAEKSSGDKKKMLSVW